MAEGFRSSFSPLPRMSVSEKGVYEKLGKLEPNIRLPNITLDNLEKKGHGTLSVLSEH